MNKTAALITITILMGLFVFFLSRPNGRGGFLRPMIGKTITNPTPEPAATPTPASTPKTYKYDSSTDLKQELEMVNPQVLDSDFE